MLAGFSSEQRTRLRVLLGRMANVPGFSEPTPVVTYEESREFVGLLMQGLPAEYTETFRAQYGGAFPVAAGSYTLQQCGHAELDSETACLEQSSRRRAGGRVVGANETRARLGTLRPRTGKGSRRRQRGSV